MAKTPQAEIKPDGETTNIAVAMQQHGFTGETCEIKLTRADPNEPAQPFFSINSYAIKIHLEKWVRVPVEMARHIESLAYTVKESDPNEPDNIEKMQWVDRARFPLQSRNHMPAPAHA